MHRRERPARRSTRGREARSTCEHFFDGYKANATYALECAKDRDRLRRPLGGDVRHQRRHAATRSSRSSPRSARVIPGANLAIHAHNDTGNAVANSLAAIRAGARQVQGALNGLGERCGNVNLVTLIPTLALKAEFSENFEIGVTKRGASARSPRSRGRSTSF